MLCPEPLGDYSASQPAQHTWKLKKTTTVSGFQSLFVLPDGYLSFTVLEGVMQAALRETTHQSSHTVLEPASCNTNLPEKQQLLVQ